MEIKIILSLAIMWYFEIVHCGNPCARFSQNEIDNIRGLFQNNVELVCNVSFHCDRVFWKIHPRVGRSERISENCNNCDYKVSNNAANGTNILHVYNLSESAIGVYTCHCEWMIPHSQFYTRSTLGCFNLTLNTLECGIKTSIKGKETITYNGNHLDQTVEKFNANINDVLTVTCLNGEQKKINCSELEHPLYEIPLRPSDTWCHFSCIKTEETATCEVSIILNVTEGLRPSTTTLTHAYSTSTRSSLYATPDSSTDYYQNIYTSMESLNELFTTQIMVPTLESDDMSSTVPSHTESKQSTYKYLNLSSEHLTTYMSTTKTEKESMIMTKLNNTLENTVHQLIFKNKVLVSFVIPIIVMSTIITVQWVYIIVIRKRYYAISSQKENWINPIYESSVNDLTAQDDAIELTDGRKNNMRPVNESFSCVVSKGAQENSETDNSGLNHMKELGEGPSWITNKYKHGKGENVPGGGSVSRMKRSHVKRLETKIKLNEDNNDINRDIFSSGEEAYSLPNERVKVRKERFNNLHFYEEANFAGTL